MVKIYEVVLELSAEEFMNVGRGTKGRVMYDLHDGAFSIQVDDHVKRVSPPSGNFTSKEEAKIALLDFWDRCDEEFVSSHTAGWLPRH